MLEMIMNLKNNDGLTLRNFKSISYKTGYQVADFGESTNNPYEVVTMIEKMGGNCGIWLENGIYYVDHSFRVSTKKLALQIGKEHNQISILKWKTMELVYC